MPEGADIRPGRHRGAAGREAVRPLRARQGPATDRPRIRVEVDGDESTLVVTGAHDAGSIGVLRRALADVIALDERDVVVDLTGATSLGDGAASLFRAAERVLAGRGRRLAIRVEQPARRGLLSLLGRSR